MLDFEITFKTKVRSPWTVFFEISLMAEVSCIYRALQVKEILPYLQNNKSHGVDEGHSKNLFIELLQVTSK